MVEVEFFVRKVQHSIFESFMNSFKSLFNGLLDCETRHLQFEFVRFSYEPNVGYLFRQLKNVKNKELHLFLMGESLGGSDVFLHLRQN